MTHPSILAFSDVTFAYPNCPIFKNVTFEVLTGQCVGVIGPNGCGKSTLFKLLLGLLSPQKGSIALHTGHFSENHRGKGKGCCVGYVPQQTQHDPLFPASTLEVILMGGISQINWRRSEMGRLKKVAYEWLEKFDLTAHADHPFSSLSGGQRQKVLLIRALILDPKLLLLDEPTNHIDAASKQFILEFISSLKGKKTVLMIMHDFEALTDHVDTILSVQDTNVLQLKPNQVCQHVAMGLYHEKKEKPS